MDIPYCSHNQIGGFQDPKTLQIGEFRALNLFGQNIGVYGPKTLEIEEFQGPEIIKIYQFSDPKTYWQDQRFKGRKVLQI